MGRVRKEEAREVEARVRTSCQRPDRPERNKRVPSDRKHPGGQRLCAEQALSIWGAAKERVSGATPFGGSRELGLQCQLALMRSKSVGQGGALAVAASRLDVFCSL